MLKPPDDIRNPALFRGIGKLLSIGLLIILALLPAAVNGQADGSPPLLVRAEAGDTPESLAKRYLDDDTLGWMIVEYNGMASFTGGQAVLIPQAPFRLGGLRPQGYQTVPVLAYPSIGSASGRPAQLPAADFEKQMSWLKNSGYVSITPEQLLSFMEFSGQMPRQAVMITADTEAASFYQQAAPILRSYGFTATLFVAPDQVGQPGNMTWDQLNDLHGSGFAIGCRGRLARSLTRRAPGELQERQFSAVRLNLQRAKAAVEANIDGACLAMAYSQGDRSEWIAAIVAKLGFTLAFVRSPGPNPFFGDRFGIHRTVIESRLDPERFAGLLTTQIAADLE